MLGIALLKGAQSFLEKMHAKGVYKSTGKNTDESLINKTDVGGSSAESKDTCEVCETEEVDLRCNTTSISTEGTLPIERCFAS